jgi:hypothetical protein
MALVTDTSGTHVGAVLQQRVSRQPWRPLGFFSQKLSPAETPYSAFDRELLAVYSSILHFCHLVEGRHFEIFSDHKPLAGALTRVSDPPSDRQCRHLSFISEFVSEIKHIAGRENVVADTLYSCTILLFTFILFNRGSTVSLHCSTPSASSSSVAGKGPPCVAAATAVVEAALPMVDLAGLAAAQSDCADCRRVPSSAALKAVQVVLGGVQLWVDTSRGGGGYSPRFTGWHTRALEPQGGSLSADMSGHS